MIHQSYTDDSFSFWKGVKKRTLLMVSASCFLATCTVKPEVDTSEDIATVEGEQALQSQRYVAFAGGGWRAHTAHSAWLVALLDNQSNHTHITTLDEAFANVSTLSSNSGGSWFNIMLSYSDKFRAGLEQKNAPNTYISNTAGYFQLEKKAFLKPSLKSSSDLCKLIDYVSTELEIACRADLDWDKFVREVVFEPFSMNADLKGKKLSDRQSWQRGKAVLLAATALSQEVVLTEGDIWTEYRKFNYSSDNLGPLKVVPVTFGRAATAHETAPRFFPGGSAPFNITYKSHCPLACTYDPSSDDPVVSGGLLRTVKGDQINVLDAASASSAAIGFLSSRAIIAENEHKLLPFGIRFDSWGLAYDGENLAPYFNLPNVLSHTVTRDVSSPPQPDNFSNAKKNYLRIADGGPLDNSGVAQSIIHHQRKYPASTKFEIIAFDNVQSNYPYITRTGKSSEIGVDLANLFGQGFTSIDSSKGTSGSCVGSFCITTKTPLYSPQIFEANDLDKEHKWRWLSNPASPSKGCTLIYTPYDVETVNNHMMGVKAGYKGTLHSFTANCPSAATAPSSASDWKPYEVMFAAIQTGLKDQTRLKDLRAAFGL